MDALRRAVHDRADRCTFGFQRRLVRRCEWLRRMPNCGFLPHTSQTDAIALPFVDSRLADLLANRWNGKGYQRPQYHPSRGGPPVSSRLLTCAASVATYRDALRNHQEELNRLNVYPVPDGDTGTNMALTLESVVRRAAGDGSDMEQVCEAIRHGSLMGARGNSGVILSQILRGLADTFSPLDSISAPDVVAGLRRATDAAYEAVLRPVEGTILTVVRLAAEAVEQASATGEATLNEVLERAANAARAAVASTPDLLPVLRDAGVVDAGGRGFELLLDACLNVVSERPVPEPEIVSTPVAVAAHLHAGDGDDISELRYEVMYFLHADDDTIPQFKEQWGELGDSIVVVGGDGIWNCHVHTNDIGGAIEAGIVAGRPSEIRVTDLHEQVEEREEEAWVREQTDGADAARPSSTSSPGWSRWRWARASSSSSPVSACSTSWPAGSR